MGVFSSRANPQKMRRHAIIWLVLAAVLGILWLVIWLMGDDAGRAIKTAGNAQSKDKSLPSQIVTLVDFQKEVKPIDFDTVVRDLRNYPSEFKDKSFFEKHRKKWTVQVMDVAEHKLIVDYLQTRDDREKFAYFRYTDVQGKERFLLTYGIMSSPQEAMGATKVIDFKLPNSARVFHEEVKRYLDIIDNYQRIDPVEEVPAPKVKLKETTTLAPPKPALPAPAEEPSSEPTEEKPSDNAPPKKEEREVPAAPAPTPPPPSAPVDEPAPTPPPSVPSKQPAQIRVVPPPAPELSVPPTVEPTAEAKFTINGAPIDGGEGQ